MHLMRNSERILTLAFKSPIFSVFWSEISLYKRLRIESILKIRVNIFSLLKKSGRFSLFTNEISFFWNKISLFWSESHALELSF